MTTTWVLLVRHGQSTWNAEGRWQGWADPPLSALGEQQARDAVEHLRGSGISDIVTSDLQRARRTGEIIAAGLGLGPITIDPDLRERDVGAFSGHTGQENVAAHPEAFDELGRLIAIPGGETTERLMERVVPALLRISHRFPGARVLTVTHGGVIRTLERHLGSPPETGTPNLGGRWIEVCEGGRIDLGEPLVTVDAELTTRPSSE